MSNNNWSNLDWSVMPSTGEGWSDTGSAAGVRVITTDKSNLRPISDYKYQHILAAVTELPWAILPVKLAVIRDLLAFRMMGGKLEPEEIAARLGTDIEAANGRAVSGGSVAVLPLIGTIIPRAGLLTESSGAVSVQGFTAKFRAALRDPDIASILIDVDSPGGQVGGVEELSAEIFNARGQKPITAVVNTLAASAAYWIATAADEMVITPSGMAGSIGVFMMHQDVSAALEAEGVKVNLISAGKFKTEGNPFEPLGEEARAAMQEMIDGYYDLFVKAVARNRGVKVSDVRDGFGEGRVVGAKQAVALGMVDRVGTFSETAARLNGNGRARRAIGADLDYRQRRLRLAESTAAPSNAPSHSNE